MPDPTTITALTALAEVPAIADVFVVDDTSAGASKSILAQYLRTLAGQAIIASGSHALAPLQAFVFTDSTDRALTLSGAPAYGWLIVIAAQAVSGGTGHTAVLPSGVTWDATNRTVTLNAATDVLIAMATSATRYLILYNNGCAFSA
jgi:hypothetical protein